MVNDLYSGLISPYLRKGKNGEQFWGLYNPLDSVETPDSTLLLKTQINNLKLLEQGINFEATNKFLKTAQKNLSMHEGGELEEKVGDEVYSRIIELMSAGLRGSSINPFKGMEKGLSKKQQKQIATERIKNLITELTDLLNKAKVNEGISKNIVSMLEKRLNVNTWNWDSTPHDYIMEKADLAEELMVDKMNQDSTLRAIVTGSWIDLSGQQLIEDAFAFDKENISIPFQYGNLSFFIKKGKNGSFKEYSASSIEDFLNQIDNLKSKKFTVKLSDELYSALQLGAAIAGQAKSGLHGQAILNLNKRNSLTLEDVGFDPRLLWQLYQCDMQSRTQFFKPENEQNSKTLEALSNYCLSKNIAKTALSANQLYLTSEGFVTASQWMQINNRYLIFTPTIRSIGGDFLTRQRPYYFTD